MTIFRILVEGIYCFCWARVGHKGINHSPIGLSFFDRFSYNSFLFWFPIVKEFPSSTSNMALLTASTPRTTRRARQAAKGDDCIEFDRSRRSLQNTATKKKRNQPLKKLFPTSTLVHDWCNVFFLIPVIYANCLCWKDMNVYNLVVALFTDYKKVITMFNPNNFYFYWWISFR